MNSYKVLIVSLFILLPTCLFARTVTISGVVKEKDSKEVLPGANVVVRGTPYGTISGLDGSFTLKGLEPGTYELEISFITYKTEIVKVRVEDGKAAFFSVELEDDAELLDAVIIETRLQRQKEQVLLLKQRESAGITQHIGAQELSRKGISDVASAVTKVTGVSQQAGNSHIFVRGLGDRYNSTTMNGLSIPSNNPEEKNISLDLFTTDIVDLVTIDKVFNCKILGDFAGGNVDITSKVSDEDFFVIELGSSVNTYAMERSPLPFQQGPDYLGFYTTTAPTSIENFVFDNSMNPIYKKPVGLDFSMAGGKVLEFKNKQEVNIFATLIHDNDYSATSEGIAKSVNSSGYAGRDLRYLSNDYKTNTTGMLNLQYKMNSSHQVNYNLIFINSSEQKNEDYQGTIEDIADFDNGRLIRRTYEKNTLLINQLLGKHKLLDYLVVNWGAAYNTISSDMPDRIQNTFRTVEDDKVLFGQNQITDNHRYFHYLREDELAGNLCLDFLFAKNGYDNYRGKLTLGGFARIKNRTFEATQFNFRILGRHVEVDPDQLDNFFNQENLEAGLFTVETFRGNYQVPFALDPQVYTGQQMVNGGLGSIQYQLTKKFTATMGVRAEYIFQEVEWNTQLDPNDRKDAIEQFELLPSISTRYALTKDQNLRFGASKTYTMPQFKERALYIYEDVTQVKQGNPDLYPSENYNVDLKWEWFPRANEIISLGAFGKYIMNPINEITFSPANSDITFANTGEYGYVAGAELEMKKNLLKRERSDLQAGFNATYMMTQQVLDAEKVQEETRYIVYFTHDEARFTGASDLLMNADITWRQDLNNNGSQVMTSLVYQYTSDYVYALGTMERGDIIDKAYGTLNLVVKTDINQRFAFGVAARNLLNPAIERIQANAEEDVLIRSYKRGINMSAKITYRF